MTSFRKRAVAILLVATTLYCTPSRAQEKESKLTELLQRSPAPANSVLYLNIPALNQLTEDAEISTRVTDNIREMWLVSDLDFANLRPRWEAGYATLKVPVDAKQIAATVSGYVDSIVGHDVVWSPRQSYLVPMKENRLGFLRPADRSMLGRWITPGGSVSESSYLSKVSDQPESYLSMMMAADLNHMVSAVPLAAKLKNFDSLQAQPPKTVASILASVRGVSVIIGRESLSQCILAVDFERSPASLTPIASDLLAEILERSGTAAPEVLTWKPKVDGNRLSFQGPISEASLTGILNIFSLLGAAESVSDKLITLSDSPGSEADRVAYTTKHYFDDVTKRVEQIRKHKSQTTGGMAKWNDQQARQIDEMGTLNVDPVMLKYSSDVASLLRGNALNVRQTNIQAGQMKAQQSLSSGSSYNVGGYSGGFYGGGAGYSSSGYYDPNSSSDYQAVTSARAQGAAYADYRSVLSQIDKLTAEIRRTMTDKYQIQF
ncbi:hypothetical protein [Allorhodopirellula solitaria]|uniref:Uncharacterized protein n=1 Tax=Allorhodopirellula solitaria TaxID=2527987 RepID=A0A5C5YHD0_9BACT|nr:hypothetical protein [Allorhodopirellula solitaria]TWT74111.1 hypothetical protein CA85_09970 [Allorhodopirellula solitaria]